MTSICHAILARSLIAGAALPAFMIMGVDGVRAETVIVVGTVEADGNGSDAIATADSPTDSVNSAFATGGPGGSNPVSSNGGNGGGAIASAKTTTIDTLGNSSSLSTAPRWG
jgi:hypothetical protein